MTAGSGRFIRRDRYVTRGKFSKAKFEEDCLAEYAQIFPTVCGDLTFYQFPSEQYWAKLFDATPEEFIFGFKVPEDITVETWPKHARYGKRAGLANEHFLNAQALEQFFTTPARSVMASESARSSSSSGRSTRSTFPTPADFLAVLDRFLKALPRRLPVRRRDPQRGIICTPHYLDVLACHNVAHVFNAWTRMPALDDQAQLPACSRPTSRSSERCSGEAAPYDKAVETFEPYDRIQEPNESAAKVCG